MIRPILVTALALASLSSLRAADAQEVVLKPAAANPLMYDTKTFTVKAGSKLKLTLDNKSSIPQPHNLIIAKPGSKDKIIGLGNAMLADPNAMAKDFVPTSPDILFHTKLVQPGQKESLNFTAPSQPGDYPYLCTFPGHSILMNGIMKVVK